MRRLSLRFLPITTIASAAAALAMAGSAQAGILVSSATNCSSESLSQPFTPWLDYSQYTLVPGGNFEAGATPWTLTGNAGVVSGNESSYIGGSGDSQSLSLSSGSSATSPAMCVGIQNPTLRMFVRNTSGFLSTLQVNVNYEDAFGNVLSTPISTVLAGSSWQPTLPMPLLVNLLPLIPGNETAVSFTFIAHGGDWQVDDTYVDPWGRCC